MAEFLIRRSNHWTRDANYASLSDLDKAELSSVPEAGDIIEIYEDGRCTEEPAPNSIYYIVKMPGVKKADVEYLSQPDSRTVNGILVIDKIRKYKMDLTLFSGISINKTATITDKDLDSKVYDKKAEGFLEDING